MKYSRSTQTVHEFSARNANEIAREHEVVRGELDRELRGLWITRKHERLAWLQQYCEDAEEEAVDEELSTKHKQHARSQAARMMRMAAEELGEIPSRTSIELTAAPELRHHIVGVCLQSAFGGDRSSCGIRPRSLCQTWPSNIT
jgi:hypothetical protein